MILLRYKKKFRRFTYNSQANQAEPEDHENSRKRTFVNLNLHNSKTKL